MAKLKLGLLADSNFQLSNLESIVVTAGFSVSAQLLTRDKLADPLPLVDVWVARVDIEDSDVQAFIERTDEHDIPVIFDEADANSTLDVEERARRFSRKIESCGLLPQNHDQARLRTDNVWVLAASAGGPEAVIEFIRSLPADVSDVAFVYVQHIDEQMAEALVKSLRRHTDWQVFFCEKPLIVYEKTVYLISPCSQVEFNEVGTIAPIALPWSGPYRPSVDQVIAKVWRKYGGNSGVIVFSGMGDDGAKTCRMIKHAGGQVWAQSPDSCAVDSMPQEVINTGCVSYIGDPEALARQFVAWHRGGMHNLVKRQSL